MPNLNYITFDQLMASVESDFSKWADNGMINRGTCIKIVRNINNQLGLKIYREAEETLKVENYKAELPEDFHYLQLALLCGEVDHFKMPTGTIWGTHTEEHNVTVPCVAPNKTCLNECGGAFWVTQIYKEKTVTVPKLSPLRLTQRSLKFCGDKCLNSTNSGAYEIDVQDGQIVTNFREGEVYINYLADMVDKEGNVMVLDHPMITPFYEYAIKKHLLENFYANGEEDVERKLGYYKNEYREARIAALNFIGTIEYTEIQDVFRANRNRFYDKYYKIFDTWY